MAELPRQDNGRRYLSHTEITDAYECQARWDFKYGGHLTGGHVLKPRTDAVRLRAGKAWGRAVAAFHGCDPGDVLHVRYAVALTALNASLDSDATQMRERGFYDQAEHHDLSVHLGDILWHYVVTTEPLHVTAPETELRLPIPSRTGRTVSNRYGFHAYLDALTRDSDGRLFIVEYKLRDHLTDFEMLVKGRQYRRYVWAAERLLGEPVAGIIVDERVSYPPKPAKWVRAKRKGEGVGPLDEKGYGRVPSHAVDQLTTEDSYRDACLEAGVDADPGTAAALAGRRWQQRHTVLFRRSEIVEAGRELVSAGLLIAQLDSGVLWPVRNPAAWRCRGCQFARVCDDPRDREVVEANFLLRAPKRDREPLLEGSPT